MANEKRKSEQVDPRWCIDLDWFTENKRSFPALAQDRLCFNCRQQLKGHKGAVSATKLLKTIKDCCSQEPGFITVNMPVTESVFRLFLANGNQPLGLEELSQQLSGRRGGDHYRTSVEVLSHLLLYDKYYGLRQVA